MRRAARTDRNHTEIVKALRSIGCEVQSLAGIGKGCPDLLVSLRQRMYLFEVKSKGGKLTPDQKAWIGKWRAPVYVVHDVDECLAMLKAT